MTDFELDTAKPLKFDICGNLRAADGFLHHRRCMDQHVLIVVLKGSLHLLADGEQVTVSQGQYLLLPAGKEHDGWKPSKGELSYLWVHFSAVQAKEGERETEHYRFPQFGQLPRNQRVTTLFRQLLDLSGTRQGRQGSMADYGCSLLLMELSAELSEENVSGEGQNGGQESHGGSRSVVREVMEYLEENSLKQIRTGDVAKHFHYNPEYLGSLFRKQTGLTIAQYLNKMRLETAKRLLENRNVGIKEAAYSSGFRDEKYFMKIFKQQEGMTPLAYQNAFTEAYINHG